VELQQVDPRQAEILQALGGVLADVLGREAILERKPRRDGHWKFFGGTFVATTRFRSGWARTTRPSRRSLCPPP
jgi:hypothetical protein